MMLRIFLVCLSLLSMASPMHANDWWDRITDFWKTRDQTMSYSIRLLLVHDSDGVDLAVQGKYCLFDPNDKSASHISTRLAGKNRRIQPEGEGLKWGETFPGLYQIGIRPLDAHSYCVIDGVKYAGEIYVYDIGGTISIVNHIPLEEHVRNVLSVYHEQELKPETFAALAIVARTNAYFQAVNPKSKFWTVEAQKVGYQGMTLIPPAVDEAADLTRYMVMSLTGIYEGQAQPFPAQFDLLSPGQIKDVRGSKITLEEANDLAKNGEHAAQILSKAFPGTTIMLLEHGKKGE